MNHKIGYGKTNRIIGMIICGLFLAASFAPATASAVTEDIIAVPGTSITIQLWEEPTESGELSAFYEIKDGGQSLRIARASYELGLRYAHFDPLESVPAVEDVLAADEDVNLYIVQFVTQPLHEFNRDITRLGGAVHHYIAQFAYLVEMDEVALEQISALPYVRWIGYYQPAYRLEEFMLDNLDNAESAYPLKRYNIQVHNNQLKSIVADRIASMGGIVEHPDAGKLLVEATLTPDQLFSVARWDEILFIDSWSPYEEDMDIVRQIGGADYIEGVAGFDGTDVRGESFDSGCQTGHIDFQHHPFLLHGSVGVASHGTATAGVCFGDGTGNATARGLLPNGQGIVASYLTIGLTGTNRYNHSGQLIQPPYNAVFQTASVGSDRTTQYSTISADADAYCFDFDLAHCQSQSNAGDQMSRPQAWAKNMFSGGGIRHYNTLSRADDMWNGGASIGPATDGRIKPTFTHFYDYVYTTYTTSTTGYGSFSGTSSATPIIAGHVGLFFEMWDAGIFGNSVNPGGSVFENRAHPATAKAVIAATAYQYDFSGLYHDKTRTHQGWGMPDLQKMYDMRNNMFIIDETEIMTQFEMDQHTVNVDAGEPELKIVMVYSDPPGNPAVQTQHRINDLTLKVISPSNVTYWGNNNLYLDPYSASGGSADDKNTVECVFIENPTAGEWTIEIYADEIIQDGHPETGALDADDALAVMGVTSTSTPGDVIIELTYQSGSPIPYSGGNLYFDVFVENEGISAADFDAWLDIEFEGGSPTTVVQRSFTNYLPGWTIDRPNMYFPVPSTYSQGNYMFYGRVGDHPSNVWDESGFPFIKNGSDYNPGFVPFVPDGVPDPFDKITNKGTDELQPQQIALIGAYPNPFNPTTSISFNLPEAVKVNLTVYDVSGRLVAAVVNGYREAGIHEVTFDASDLASGIYLYRMDTDGFTASGKMVLMK